MPATPATPVVPLGKECKVYMLSTGTRATWATVGPPIPAVDSGPAPTSLVEVSAVKDVKINSTKGEGEASARSSDYKIVRGALKDTSIDITIPMRAGDAGFAALSAAYYGNTMIALAILNGPSTTVGTSGMWADWEVMEFTEDQPLENVDMVTVKLKPGASAVPPQHVTVATGS